jgi:glutathione S-transferase
MTLETSDPALILYNAPASTCSQKVRMALAEKGLPWRDRRVNLNANEHLEDWYLKINPNGVVPTLDHAGRIVLDSSVINEYLEDVFPAKPLLPAEPWARAHVRAWRQYIDEVPTPAIRVPSFNAFILRGWSGLSDEEFGKLVEKRTVRKHFYRKMGRQGFGAAEMTEALERLRDACERMQRALGDSLWVAGDGFSHADIALMPSIVRLEDLGLTHIWEGLPRVADWYARLKARPAFAVTYYEGSRPKGAVC